MSEQVNTDNSDFPVVRQPLDAAQVSTAWTAADIATQQRELVDAQLAAMRAGHGPRHFEVMRDVMAAVVQPGAPQTLLDAGCASCYYYEILNFYHPRRFDYTGVDFSQALLDMAATRYPGVKTLKRDLRVAGLAPQSYDVVLTGAALMHIRDWREALDGLAAAARRWLILHRTWVVDGETRIEIKDAYGHPAWYIRFEEVELVERVANAGFELRQTWRDVEAGCECRVNTYLFERK